MAGPLGHLGSYPGKEPRMKLDELYPSLARISLVLFVLTFVIHLLALTELVRIHEVLVFPLLLPLFPAQFVVIYAINGGTFFPKRQTIQTADSWSYFLVALKFMPARVRYFGLVYWYLYAPVLLVLCAIRDNMSAFIAIGIGAMAMAHYIGFQYLLPRRKQIIDAVNENAG